MIIDARNLSFRYDGAAHDTLRTLDFRLPKGSLSCLVGTNGSGKSTLLTVLSGLLPPTGGSLQVAGATLPRDAAQLRGRVALVPQDPDLYIFGSLVKEDLLLAIDPDNEPARAMALTLAQEFGLADYFDQPVHILSYGQKRKLCLASALAALCGQEAGILLLDEPFSGLDFPASRAIRTILQANKEAGLTQLVITHDLDFIADLCDVFLLLEKGRLTHQGDAEAVFPNLLTAGVKPPCWWLEKAPVPRWLSPP